MIKIIKIIALILFALLLIAGNPLLMIYSSGSFLPVVIAFLSVSVCFLFSVCWVGLIIRKPPVSDTVWMSQIIAIPVLLVWALIVTFGFAIKTDVLSFAMLG